MSAVIDELPRALRDQRVGNTQVNDVRIRFDDDSAGLLALFVILVLANPQGREETWPVDDLWGLRRLVRDRLNEVAPDLDTPWFVAFEPERAEELEPGDITEEVDFDDVAGSS